MADAVDLESERHMQYQKCIEITESWIPRTHPNLGTEMNFLFLEHAIYGRFSLRWGGMPFLHPFPLP